MDGKKNSNCCYGGGRRQRPAKAKWCSCPARQGSASPGSRRRCWNASLPSRTRASATSARRSTPSARFYPIISQMERAAGFAHDDTAQAKLDKLDAVLALSLTPRQDAALFAEMLSLPNDGRYPTLELVPQQRRQKTLEALNCATGGTIATSPVLMIFEDVHWIDPTSLEALGRTVDRLRTLRALLIVTYRPEFEPPWIGRPHVTAPNAQPARRTRNRRDD